MFLVSLNYELLKVRPRRPDEVHEEEHVHAIDQVGLFRLAEVALRRGVVLRVLPQLGQVGGPVEAVGGGGGVHALLAVEEDLVTFHVLLTISLEADRQT